MHPPEPRLVSAADAAIILGVNRATIYRMLTAGTLPVVRIGGRRMIDRHDLDTYIDQQKASAE